MMNMRYCNVVNRYRYATFPLEFNMELKELKDHERIAKQIAKTSNSIRKSIAL